jgi:Protein of unknown function (DUF732)
LSRAKRDVQHADVKSRIALASLAIASLAFAAPATASTPEDTYLAALARHGITGDPQALIDAGHDVCWALNQNWVVIGEALWKAQSEYAGQGIVGPAYGQARHDAVNALCPDKSSWRN